MTVILPNKVDDDAPWDDFMLRGLAALASSKADESVDWAFMTRGAVEESNEANEEFYPFPSPGGVSTMFSQRCVDTVTGVWTPWVTDFKDVGGSEYPGYGFDAATYKVESVIHGRMQL